MGQSLTLCSFCGSLAQLWGLQHALAEERRRLFEVHTETIDDAVFERPDRKIGPQILGWANGNWIRVAMPILQPYF